MTSADFIPKVRTQYAALIDVLFSAGEIDQARKCAATAVAHGVWKDPLQRPTEFDARLPSRALYEPDAFWFVRYLEERYPIIQEEVAGIVDPRRQGFSQVEEPLVGCGQWDEVIFYEDGIRMERSCTLFPRTAAIMSEIPEAIQSGGVVMLSWLGPGSRIVPHCGRTNTKLRVHLGIKVPEGAWMRVGTNHVVWREGRCVVFDDSFEHEVWNASDEPRLVLLFDIIHPDLPAGDRMARMSRQADLESTVASFLTTRGLVGVERDPVTGELTLIPDEPTTLTMTRYMKDHNVTRVQLAGGTLVTR